MRAQFKVEPGDRFPPGATVRPGGVNFSIFSRHATSVELLLFRNAADAKPLQVIKLDPELNVDYFFWHVFVVGAEPGLYYSWRVDGPRSHHEGFLFDPSNELLDPWAREVSDVLWNRAAKVAGQSAAIRGRVVDVRAYDWEGDVPLTRPIEDEIIYELHVAGFTKHPSSGVAKPGTFAGLIEKIPYLKLLGITAVELLPVMAFDKSDVPPGASALGHSNYWGYSTYGFHAVHPHYSAAVSAVNEFRDMVKALHREGIAVILDVVFNHTSEGGRGGPIINFKGLGNEFFYHLDPHDSAQYRDYTGCGNTVNCNHPAVTKFIVRCLEYWVTEMHVDGFRFDLASVFARNESGEPVGDARVIWDIEYSPILSSRVLIAEPWDAAGLYQVGSFPGFAWREWNDSYRDTMRAFGRGDGGLIGQVATRLCGSNDLYDHSGRGPTHSINFITCHDGFTLADLVSYDSKHNHANGEDNRDGHGHNLSWNSGAEGPTDNLAILRLREQRARNYMTLLMLSLGVPMLTAGDEMLRTQNGNNNAYCQDNALSWLDWSGSKAGARMLRFTSELIAFRKRHRSLRRRYFIQHEEFPVGALHWYSFDAKEPDWHDSGARSICFMLAGLEPAEPPLYVMINMSDVPLTVKFPNLRMARKADALRVPTKNRKHFFGRGSWRRIVDTSLQSPEDIVVPENAERVGVKQYDLAARAIAIFERF